jgi:CBS domain-containing protein
LGGRVIVAQGHFSKGVSMQVADVMTRSVVTVAPDALVADAIHLMLDKRISGIPVVDADGHLVGIVTEGDFLRRAETGTEKKQSRWRELLFGNGKLAEDYVHSHGRHVRDVMTTSVVSVTESASLEHVVDEFERRRVRRFPVVDGANRLAGIISRSDLLRILAKTMLAGETPAVDDVTLRERVIKELSHQRWADDNRVAVTVAAGVVHLKGVVFDTRHRDAIRVAAENVPGVVAVQDEIEYLEPNVMVAGM